MLQRLNDLYTSPVTRRRALIGALVFLGFWVVFLDSHSILKRVQYSRERAALKQEVEHLREANTELEGAIERGISDEIIERVAREQYGMRRPGETVYPVEVLDN